MIESNGKRKYPAVCPKCDCSLTYQKDDLVKADKDKKKRPLEEILTGFTCPNCGDFVVLSSLRNPAWKDPDEPDRRETPRTTTASR